MSTTAIKLLNIKWSTESNQLSPMKNQFQQMVMTKLAAKLISGE